MTQTKDASYWISRLGLARHPEGGYFAETYRSPDIIPHNALPKRFGGDRRFSTAIYYLLEGDDYSSFHRIASDEIWHFYAGSPLTIHCLDPDRAYRTILLGSDPDSGEILQATVEAGTWFAAEINKRNSFSLIGCTVAPGFEFQDFEEAKREELSRMFPGHDLLIRRLTRK